MEEIFYRQICSVCLLKDKCKNFMKHKKSGEIDIYYCSTYLKDAKKVIPYKDSLEIINNKK